MICKEYTPAITHSDISNCHNCRYRGMIECTNTKVRKAMKQAIKEVTNVKRIDPTPPHKEHAWHGDMKVLVDKLNELTDAVNVLVKSLNELREACMKTQ